MTNITDTHSGRDGERRSDLAVMDQEEYKNKRRLERILDAHDRVEEIDSRTEELYISGEMAKSGREVVLLRAVQQFIRECVNLLRAHHREHQEPGEPLVFDGYWVTHEELGHVEFEASQDVVFYGLRDIMMAQRTYEDVTVETIKSRHGPNKVKETQEVRTVPESVSLHAYTVLKEFLDRERGLDLSFSASEKDSTGEVLR